MAADGALTNKRLFADIDAIAPKSKFRYREAGPDGLERGPDGEMVVSIYGEGRLLRIGRDGKLVGEIKVPTQYETNIAFGAPGAVVVGAFENACRRFLAKSVGGRRRLERAGKPSVSVHARTLPRRSREGANRMGFKTAKIAAVVAAQLCWLVLTYTVFGGFGDATKTVSWMVMVALVLLLPLTLCLWYAFNPLAAFAARAPAMRFAIYAGGGVLVPPVTLAALAAMLLFVLQTFAQYSPVLPQAHEIAMLFGCLMLPGLFAGLVMAQAAPRLEPRAVEAVAGKMPALPPMPAAWKHTLSALIARANAVEIREPYAVLVKPTLRAAADPYRRSGLVLAQAVGGYVIAMAAYQFLGQPLFGLLGPLFGLGQIAIGWAFLCLLANRLRALGAPPDWRWRRRDWRSYSS